MFNVDWRENTITITGGVAQNAQFDTGIPKGALERILFIMVGANNSIGGSGISSYVFTLNGDEWLNVLPTELRALLEFIYSRYGGAAPGSNDLTWPLPLDLFAMLLPPENGIMPQVGLPANTKKVFLIRGNTNLSAGSMEIGWKAPNRDIDYVPYLIGQVINGLVASTNEQRFELNVSQFPCAGFIIDMGTTEFSRIKFFLADENGKTREVFDMKNDHIQMQLQPYSANSITDPVFIPFDYPVIIRPGSYLLINTGAGYDGSQRLVPVMFMPAKKATAPKAASPQ